jgi:hypothetical protein
VRPGAGLDPIELLDRFLQRPELADEGLHAASRASIDCASLSTSATAARSTATFLATAA